MSESNIIFLQQFRLQLQIVQQNELLAKEFGRIYEILIKANLIDSGAEVFINDFKASRVKMDKTIEDIGIALGLNNA